MYSYCLLNNFVFLRFLNEYLDFVEVSGIWLSVLDLSGTGVVSFDIECAREWVGEDGVTVLMEVAL